MAEEPRQCCKNCHFLVKHSDQLPLRPWDEDDRESCFPRVRIPPEKLQHEKYSTAAASYDMKIGCEWGVWTEKHNEYWKDEAWFRKSIRSAITKDRVDQCPFLQYHEGMSMEKAKDFFDVKQLLQQNKKLSDHNERVIEQNNRRIKWGLVASGAAGFIALLSLGWQVFNVLFLGNSAPSP